VSDLFRKFLLSVCTCLGAFTLATAQPASWPAPILLAPGTERQLLGPGLLVLPDPGGTFTWQTVRQMAAPPANALVWQPDTQLAPQGVYWIKLLINNRLHFDQAISLTITNKFYINHIDAYAVHRGQLSGRASGGIYRPASQVIGPRFSPTFMARANQTTELYLRLENFHGYPVKPTLELQKAEVAATRHWHRLIANGLLASAFVVLIVYNFFLYFIRREPAYLYYVGYLVGLVLVFLFEDLQLFGVILPEHPAYLVAGYYLWIDAAIICYANFISQIFGLAAAQPRAARLNRWLIKLTLAKMLLQQGLLWTTHNHLWTDLLTIAIILGQLGLIATVLYHLRRQTKGPGRWVLAGTSSMALAALASVGLNLAVITGWIQGGFENNIYLLQLGGIADAVCFSLALGAKARLVQQEKQTARAALLALQNAQAEQLAKSVGQRSEELATAHQELWQQKEELTALAEQLETQVRHRTAQLASAVENLEQYNQQLAYFSDTLAHQLAPPLADIMTLLTQSDTAAQGQLVHQAQTMDSLLRDLNRHFGDLKIEFSYAAEKQVLDNHN
jgi:7TM diverse intracellular signalling/7TMR-DISM extracellular 2